MIRWSSCKLKEWNTCDKDADNAHLKNVMSLPCLRRTGLVGSLGESDWSEFRLEKKENWRGKLYEDRTWNLHKWWLLPTWLSVAVSRCYVAGSTHVEPVQRSGISSELFSSAPTLSPMTSTHSQGKNPTSKPRLPRHHIDSSGPGMSITEIMSPTCAT